MSANDIYLEEVKTVHKITRGGLEAYAEAYAAKYGDLKFLSFFGNRVSVRAIWSALLDGVTIDIEKEEFRLDTRDSWQILQKILPSGILQAVCIPKALELEKIKDGFIVLGRDEPDMQNRFYIYLDRIAQTPIRKEWNEYIFECALRDDLASRLDAFGIVALDYSHDEAWLEELITDFVRCENKVAV